MAGLVELVSQFVQDLRYSLRSFKASPGFVLAAIVTIGLGVGVNTGIFSIVNAIAFSGLPASHPEELVTLTQDVVGVRRASNNNSPFTLSEYETYRDRTETLTGVLAYGRMWDATLGGDVPRMVIATPVSCNFFDVLGRPPEIGSAFSNAHCRNPGDATVAVITHDLWVDRFDGDPSVLGQSVTLNGTEFQIIGVAAEGFNGIDIDRPSLFVPAEARTILRPDRNQFDDDTLSWLNLVGRRAPGVSADQVEAEWNVIARQFDAGQAPRATTVTVSPARRLSAPEMRTAVLTVSALVMTAFGLVLLVACANVANLMLARADLRTRETAIRSSLGATRARLIRQFVTESVLIAVAGGLAGAILAAWAIDGLVVAALSALPQEAGLLLGIEFEPNIAVFLFALGLSMLAGIGFGLVPALLATRPELRTMMDQDAPGRGGRNRGRLQGVLVGMQVAFSMVLVVATALLLRGFYETLTVDPDFDHEQLLIAGADLGTFGYTPDQAAQFQQRAIDEIRALPGVDDVAQVLIAPLEARSRSFTWSLPGEPQEGARPIEVNYVSANFFAVSGIEIVRGRAFTEAEVAAEQWTAAILTESTARSIWPNENALGKTLISGFGTPVEVVGIAQDIEVSIGQSETPYIYTPAIPVTQTEMQLVVRTGAPVASLVEPINMIYRRLDARLPARVQTFDELFGFWSGVSAVATSIAFGLGGLALLLAAVGVYGVMATVVGCRLREIGIRLALGAGKADVLRLMLARSMRPVAIGAAIGALACFAVARLLSVLLFGVGALDVYALSGAGIAVLGAGFLASFIPAKRAMTVSAMTTLRYE